MSKSGAIEAAASKGVDGAKVEHPEEGVYCISGLGFTPRSVEATIDSDEPVVPLVSATVGAGKFSSCNAQETQVTVETWAPAVVRNGKGENEVQGATADRAFYLSIN